MSLYKKATLEVMGTSFSYVPLDQICGLFPDVKLDALPISQKILLENMLRTGALQEDIHKAALPSAHAHTIEIGFSPARVLMQDFTGVPAIVDLAAMRDAAQKLGKDPTKVNPLVPVDLVIDHSVIVDNFGDKTSFEANVKREYERNIERYRFLKWGQKAFRHFRVVPPGTGICHQVNLEYLASVVFQSVQENGEILIYPDTVVGTDSHTTMVNGLSVLGWGVGGIEAEAAMLGQPISMVIPEVIGMRLTGRPPEGTTATDLVLFVTNILRAKGVVGKFVEFYGDGVQHLSLADRATLANMAPEYGATCGFFGIDEETLSYMRFTGRSDLQVALTTEYAKIQGLWRDAHTPDPIFADTLTLDLRTIRPTLAGPKRPQDKVLLEDAKASCEGIMTEGTLQIPLQGKDFPLTSGDVVIAAITSCTNTSNPSVMMAAGLLARKARALGLTSKPWVKTSLAPGSKVVMEYLNKSDLTKDLEELGFYLVGYGCTTCIGNSGPLDADITKVIEKNDLTVAAVLSGNRNFEGRVNPHAKANYLASPPLVVAYALAGTMLKDLTKEPLAQTADGKDVYLKDIWPSSKEIADAVAAFMSPDMFRDQYAKVFEGDATWQAIHVHESSTYAWENKSTYVQHPPYFYLKMPADYSVKGARILALLGDSITTDHISPAGNIKIDSPAGLYLGYHGVTPENFNAYGARRGNHEVMIRGTFANIRLKNELLEGVTGGFTRLFPSGEQMSIYEAAQHYQKNKTPTVVIAGKEYGTGSSRDWAAKGTRLLGVRAVIAESFERIHRSNLVGMGILPLLFPKNVTRKTLNMRGDEIINIEVKEEFSPNTTLTLLIHDAQGVLKEEVSLHLAIQTNDEMNYFNAGGILPYVLNAL